MAAPDFIFMLTRDDMILLLDQREDPSLLITGHVGSVSSIYDIL